LGEIRTAWFWLLDTKGSWVKGEVWNKSSSYFRSRAFTFDKILVSKRSEARAEIFNLRFRSTLTDNTRN
jgi:hypothetical protein